MIEKYHRSIKYLCGWGSPSNTFTNIQEHQTDTVHYYHCTIYIQTDNHSSPQLGKSALLVVLCLSGHRPNVPVLRRITLPQRRNIFI